MEDKIIPPFPPPPPNIGAKMKDDVKNSAPTGGVSFPLPPKPSQGKVIEEKEMPQMAPPQLKNADENMASEQDAKKKKPIDKVKVWSISGVAFGGLLLIACLVLVFVI